MNIYKNINPASINVRILKAKNDFDEKVEYVIVGSL
jgi:hypothetical protein